MGSLCIVPEEVLHQSDVELFQVKEFILMIIIILLLEGAMKAFGMGNSSWVFSGTGQSCAKVARAGFRAADTIPTGDLVGIDLARTARERIQFLATYGWL